MAERLPLAFMSYVRSDDEHDGGKITRFRERLEGEVKMQTGRPFSIFQDRNDIQWGQQWEQRIAQSLADVTFLIPVVTPSFFESPACRSEFNAFLLREKTVGVARLILPLIYLDCDQLGASYAGNDSIADILRERNWTDWRPLRFKGFDDENVLSELARMAKTVKDAMKQLDAIISQEKAATDLEATAIESEAKGDIKDTVDVSATYYVPEARSEGKFDDAQYARALKNPYRVYTRRFDEVVSAQDLAEPGDLMRLYRFLVKSSPSDAAYESYTRQISNWVARMDDPPSISVTLLLDNSGSMRGAKILNLATSMLLATEWLERWRIRTEVLGFTTRAWKGGQSRDLWLSDGKRESPGRLNDLRHVVYKSFDESTISAAPGFGIMVREGLLKENVDGEALLWAYARLLREQASIKLLFMFSDGAPVDDATLSVQDGNFLQDHFISVLKMVEDEGKVQFKLIGIDRSVSEFGADAIEVKNGKLAMPIFSTLRHFTRQQKTA